MDKIMDIRESTRFRDEALKKKQKLLDGIVAEKRGYTDDEKVRVDALTNEIEKYDDHIRLYRAREYQITGRTPEEIQAAIQNQGEPGMYRGAVSPGQERGFQPRGYTTSHRNFGEFVRDCRFNPENLRVMSMGVGATGGFTVPDQFIGQIFQVTPESSIVRPRATPVPGLEGSPDAASLIPALDSEAGAHGGVEVSWISEGGDKPLTEPELYEISLQPEELAGHLVVTDKLLRNNAANLSIFLEKVFREAIFAAEDRAFLNGTGTGMPLGVLNSPARLDIARAGAGAVAFADICGMISVFMPDSWTRGVWVINVSVLPQLMAMVDAGNHRIFVGKDNMRGLPPSLIGIPVIFTGRTPTLGNRGDVMLCDFEYYLVKTGFGPAVAASEHVLFKSNKTVIKAFHNVDGEPWVRAPITLEDNSTTCSPFVILE